jgi:DNA-binding FadR family transcriptional regulator
MRLQLEPVVIRELAERHSEADVRVLQELIQAERAGGYDPVEAPDRFRRALADRSPNVASAVMLSLLGEFGHQHNQLARKRRSESELRKFGRVGHQMRSDLVDLIAAGDADGAEALWREYLVDSQRVVGRQLLQTRIDVLS